MIVRSKNAPWKLNMIKNLEILREKFLVFMKQIEK
jgi:hypothetical protein